MLTRSLHYTVCIILGKLLFCTGKSTVGHGIYISDRFISNFDHLTTDSVIENRSMKNTINTTPCVSMFTYNTKNPKFEMEMSVSKAIYLCKAT